MGEFFVSAGDEKISCVKGICKRWHDSFFKLEEDNERRYWTRYAARRHQKQLKEPRQGAFLEVLRRSALGLVSVYNLLPEEVVLEETVRASSPSYKTY